MIPDYLRKFDDLRLSHLAEAEFRYIQVKIREIVEIVKIFTEP